MSEEVATQEATQEATYEDNFVLEKTLDEIHERINSMENITYTLVINDSTYSLI